MAEVAYASATGHNRITQTVGIDIGLLWKASPEDASTGDGQPPTEVPQLQSIVPGRKIPLRGKAVALFESSLLERGEDIEEGKEESSSSGSSSSYRSAVIEEDVVTALEGVQFIDDVLSRDECEALCRLIDENESLSFWANSKDNNEEMFRNADTIEFDSHPFANKLWSRLQQVLSSLTVTIPTVEEDPSQERELVGCWRAAGLNHDMLFAKYPPGGSFSPHTDGRAVHGFNHRSFYSVIVFLKDIPQEQGGGTRFYQDSAVSSLRKCVLQGQEYWTADEKLVTGEVSSVAGRFLLFNQKLVHEGVPVLDPACPHCKYIIRSDVMFRREPALCDSERDRQAYALFREAEALAEDGAVSASIQLFSRALKLSPEMARIMGQG